MNFDHTAFAVFNEPELAGRMAAIQARIQPTFQYFGDILAEHLQEQSPPSTEVFVHIAKHLRRTTYPPESTWVAIGGDKRGYKKYPHFQIGINEHYVFFTLALIDNPLYEKEIAQLWQQKLSAFKELPQDFAVIPDHTQFGFQEGPDIDWANLLERLEKVKKAELMIGRIYPKDLKILSDSKLLTESFIETLDELMPLYMEAMSFY